MKSFTIRFKSKRIRKAAARLIKGVYDYHRIGYDHRPMAFQPDGMIGEGAKGREVFWCLKENVAGLFLEISSTTDVTCRLKEGLDHVWRGRWIRYERMPVELSPITGGHQKSPRIEAPTCDAELAPDSLFVVSLPRSLSTLLYHTARHAVGLHEPAWTSDGEILNLDRFALLQGSTEDVSRKFISPHMEPQTFYAATEFLNQLIVPYGHAYKDVVQPFIVAEWMKRRSFRTIRIKRNIADVAYAMLNRQWSYPAQLFPKTKDAEVGLVRGLIQAEQALASIPAQCLDFDELILDEKPLRAALRTLYPNVEIAPVKFIDGHFREMRQQILQRRETEKHKMLTNYVEKYSPQAGVWK